MAVAYPVPASILPMNNKLQSKLNLLKEVIERDKSEVRRVGGEMKNLISRKENAIIKELDGIWDEVNSRIDKKIKTVQDKMKLIETRNKEMKKNYEDMQKLFKEMSQTLPPLPEISETVESAKREFDTPIPYLKLTFRTDEVMRSIDRMCEIEQVVRENTPFQLQWSKCERGGGVSQLDFPCGIAINPVNGNIHVTDKVENRVQIFTKVGEWIRSLKDEKLIYPRLLLMQAGSIYILCEKIILIFDLSDETKKEISKYYEFPLGGICADEQQVYVSTYTDMKLIFFDHKLAEENQIDLYPHLCESASNIRDMVLARDEFYILISETEYPVQAFSKEGILTRCVVHKDCISNALYFCLDQQLNLIISDRGDSKIKVISNDGKLLNQISRHEGDFTELAGVAVDELGCVVGVDRGHFDMLQGYTPI